MEFGAGAALASPRVGLNSPENLSSSLRNEDVRLLLLKGRSSRGRGARLACSSSAGSVRALKKSEEWNYPWPKKITKDMQKDVLKLLCNFKPLLSDPKVDTLKFEEPIVQLQKKIQEIRNLANEHGMDCSEQLEELQQKYDQVRQDLYKNLTPVQRLSLARHPNRPTMYDHVLNMTDKWLELHGDREGHDDPAIVSGIGTLEGMSFMFIGQQKGRNTKENLHRNFAMPHPWGYRKALRMMKHAAHHGFPILTFVDTPGAFPHLEAEEAGQGEAIAMNLREMFGLEVPIISTVIGEGGSGGALAIGCCNKMLMLENSVYYVASPEACGAILWKSKEASAKAAEALKITPSDLLKLKIVDEVIPEPLGGAQYDPVTTSKNMKQVLLRNMEELLTLDRKQLLQQRHQKFRAIGEFNEGLEIDPLEKRNMKGRDVPVSEEELFLPATAPAPAPPSSGASTNGSATVRVEGFSIKSVEFATERVIESV